MNMQIEMAIQFIDQAASEQLEAAEAAVRSGDQAAALAAIGQAISALGAARDSLQDIPREPMNIGLAASF